MSWRQPKSFATTHWSLVAEAGGAASPECRAALSTLCELYWYPLYAFVRRKGFQAAEAQDLTQSFFTELLEKDRLQLADQQRGKFRSFLLGALNHFLANQRRAKAAQKRGGDHTVLSIDFDDGETRYQREPVDTATPEKIFERRWTMTLLDRAVSRLRDEFVAAGNLELFDQLKLHLGGDPDAATFGELAKTLQMTEGAIKAAAHRLRKRCRELLREEIARTVCDPGEIDDELKELFTSLQV
ncbi:MAG TPA: sigma-70 family RNA polymerase sigma factor [Pirellulaceae bacterium]|jgi:RNA polymerase sigma-70 factor (ECF subfamily)|nr:sigma-70 family RNA polymerase sigma factor [Pirellulaceae bacterium]